MAKPIYNLSTQKPVGFFIATTSQQSKRAPFPKAEKAAELGAVAGEIYIVYVAVKVDNIVWLRLDSQVPNTPEWVREKTETGGSVKSYGVYVGNEPLLID